VTARAAILATLEGRRGTICPSEAARRLAPDDWRDRMPEVRAAACQLADEGVIQITQKGVVVDGRSARGPIRLRSASSTVS
jgi:hypothetical protein